MPSKKRATPISLQPLDALFGANADFGAAINEIVSAHPECSETTMEYDYEDGHTWASYWPEVLAIFAVDTNLNSDSDVIVINAAQKQSIPNSDHCHRKHTRGYHHRF